MTPRKQCLPDTRGVMYILIQRDCGSMYNTYTESSQKESQHWDREVDTGSNPQSKSYLQLIPASNRKINSLQKNVKHTLGKASGPGVVGLHKTKSMFFFGGLLILNYDDDVLVVCLDFHFFLFWSFLREKNASKQARTCIYTWNWVGRELIWEEFGEGKTIKIYCMKKF